MSAPPITADELIAKAHAAFAAQHPAPEKGGASASDVLLGEIPSGDGRMLTVVLSGGKWPVVRFRGWDLGPGGTRVPLRHVGFALHLSAMPLLAEIVAKSLDTTLDLPEWSRSFDNRPTRHPDTTTEAPARRDP